MTPGSASRVALLPAALAVAVGILVGLGGFVFTYAQGVSYFSTDPRACTNCHIMQREYDAWEKASHHGDATCVDCHLPLSFVAKYIAKAKNGYFHSKGFTLEDFHEPIRIKSANAHILQENCLRCHGPMVDRLVPDARRVEDAVECVHCHAGVGHGETAGLGGPLRPGELVETRRVP
jgi:cytochrome c nitrite reductase small subunit